MIVFVDYEHADGRSGDLGQQLLAARTWITYRLEDLAGRHCMLVRYDRISEELLDRIDARAILVSGNATDPEHYDPEALRPIIDIIGSTELAIFGFCGGFQLIAQALGAPVELIAPPEGVTPESDERLIALNDGRPFEFGYHPIDVAPEHVEHPVLDGIRRRPIFRHAHGLHVPTPPTGFRIAATNDITPVQLAIHDDRRIVGSQFHPEYWTDEHPDGRTLIANFLRWSGVT